MDKTKHNRGLLDVLDYFLAVTLANCCFNALLSILIKEKEKKNVN